MTRILFILLLLFTCGCQQVQQHASKSKLEHIVLVWLKDSSDANRQKVMQASKSLFKIEELKAMDMGTTIQSDRSIVDDSYDIAYIMTFDNQKDMEAYLVHPVHVKLVEEVLKPSMKKVQVYDIIISN